MRSCSKRNSRSVRFSVSPSLAWSMQASGLCHTLAKLRSSCQNSRLSDRSASPSRSELPPASAIAPQQFKRARRALAARGIEFQSFGAHSSPGIKERLNRPPSGFHAFGALKKNVVAYHAIVDQGLIAGCGLGLEVVLVKKLHLYAVDPDQRPRDLGVEAQRDPFCRLDADDEIVLSQLLDRGASKHRERGLAEFDRYFGALHGERLAGTQVKGDAGPAPVVNA